MIAPYCYLLQVDELLVLYLLKSKQLVVYVFNGCLVGCWYIFVDGERLIDLVKVMGDLHVLLLLFDGFNLGVLSLLDALVFFPQLFSLHDTQSLLELLFISLAHSYDNKL